MVFTAADPYVLGIGFAAWRDVATFFKTAAADDAGTPNPIAKMVKHSATGGATRLVPRLGSLVVPGYVHVLRIIR